MKFSLFACGLSALVLVLETARAIDEDADGLSDVFESLYGGDLAPSDDGDDDGFNNMDEYLLGGNPTQPDLFGFAEYDADVGALTWQTAMGLRYRPEMSVALGTWEPISGEVEGDGGISGMMLDASTLSGARVFVRIAALEPLDVDSDLLNAWEENMLGTDPFFSDSDGDRIPDGTEVSAGLDPTDASSVDGDVIPDDWEVFHFGDTGGGETDDPDGDGLD